jgi:transcriptional regulator with XRE-family HTH domain
VISLAELRALAGLTVEQLAGLMNATADAVRQIEALEPELLEVADLVAYCGALGLRVVITARAPGLVAPHVLLDTGA